MNLSMFIKETLLLENGKLNSRKSNKKWLDKNYPGIYDDIYKHTDFLNKDVSLSIRLYCIYNNIKSPVYCSVCNKNQTKFINFKEGFRKYCSLKCVNKSKDVIKNRKNTFSTLNWKDINKKRKQTKLEKYGDENYNNYHKMKSTKQNIYGDENYNNREKSKETCLEKYGFENFMLTKEFKKKTKNALNKYNIENFSQLKETKDKVKQTKLEKYGDENYNNREKSKETCLEKYGVDTPSKSVDIQQKIQNTNLEKYGSIYFLGSKIFKNQRKNKQFDIWQERHIKNIDKLNKSYIEKNFKTTEGFIDIKKMSEFYNVGKVTIYRKLKMFDIEYKTSKSSYENEIYNFLNCYVNNIKTHERNIIGPFELDFYLSDYNLAIEFNGNYYHYDEILQDKFYHLNKTKLCEKNGIQLIHIFQYQWDFKQDIVKSIILSKLNKIENKIYARKCIVKEIDNKTKNKFLEENHLQGKDISKVKLGLYYNNELVSVMTFGKPRFNKNYEWELIRFCNKKFSRVIGGAGKLFHYFINTYESKNVISYANRQFNNGNFYEKIGFDFVNTTDPNFFYVKNNDYFSRLSCQKHKLDKLLDKFDENLSASENMKINGYHRIYDSGNKTYCYINKIM